MIFWLLLAGYCVVSAVALLWIDEKFGLDLTDGEPLLAGLYALMAPMLVPFAVLAGVLWVLGAVVLRAVEVLSGKSGA